MYGALTTYFPLGIKKYDPVELAQIYEDAGVDVIEVGIPVTNPHLDGRLVRETMEEALSVHTDLDWYLEQLNRIHNTCKKLTIDAFSYKEVYEEIGMRAYVKMLQDSGADCMMVPDITEEEKIDHYITHKDSFPLLEFLPFDAEDSYVEEQSKIPFKGFILQQATAGKTGMRDELEPDLEKVVRRAKKAFSQPVYVGFGISKPEHTEAIMKMGADGVVIGSRVVDYVMNHSENELSQMLREYKQTLKIEEV